MNTKKQQTFTLCGETLTGPMHICAFFDSREEQYETLLPWIKEGINNKEEIVNILHGDLHCDHCSRLSKADIAVESAVAKGQLKVLASEDTYLNGGVFAAESMVRILEQALIDAQNMKPASIISRQNTTVRYFVLTISTSSAEVPWLIYWRRIHMRYYTGASTRIPTMWILLNYWKN